MLYKVKKSISPFFVSFCDLFLLGTLLNKPYNKLKSKLRNKYIYICVFFLKLDSSTPKRDSVLDRPVFPHSFKLCLRCAGWWELHVTQECLLLHSQGSKHFYGIKLFNSNEWHPHMGFLNCIYTSHITVHLHKPASPGMPASLERLTWNACSTRAWSASLVNNPTAWKCSGAKLKRTLSFHFYRWMK